MTSWLPRDDRARAGSTLRTWFSLGRWSPNDALIAVAAVILAVALFLPWFKAVIYINGNPVGGFSIQSPGTASGIAIHGYLWTVFGLALLQFAVLAARYAPRRPALKLPGYRQFLVVASGLCFITVLVGAFVKPVTWYGGNNLGDGFTIGVGWDWGALVALGAAVVSVAMAVAAIRDRPRGELSVAGESGI